VLDAQRLRVTPAARQTGDASYSIGRPSYFEQRVGNAHYFFLDTRGHRDVGDVKQPQRADLSMLGAKQKAWLKYRMTKSDADVLFVVSQVMLMIPHVGGSASATGFSGPPRPVVHDEAWPVFLAEREELIAFWDALGKTVLVLSGDTHNSFSIRITDRVWEMASGPHNSRNHRADSEGFRPPNGIYDSRGRPADIRWSSYFHPDMPAALIRQPIYTVVQMNNVMNNPVEPGKDRWIAYPHGQVVVQFYHGLTGDLLYAESIRIERGSSRTP
jgi:alkaline phosphatase D